MICVLYSIHFSGLCNYDSSSDDTEVAETNSKPTSDRNENTKSGVIHGKNRKSEERDRMNRPDKRRSRDSSLRFVDFFWKYKRFFAKKNVVNLMNNQLNDIFNRRKSKDRNHQRTISRNHGKQYNQRWGSRSKTKFFHPQNMTREPPKGEIRYVFYYFF